MDKETLEFVTYCISKPAQILNLSQGDVYDRDLTDYMREKGVLPEYQESLK